MIKIGDNKKLTRDIIHMTSLKNFAKHLIFELLIMDFPWKFLHAPYPNLRQGNIGRVKNKTAVCPEI
jgi:hypothetical protein